MEELSVQYSVSHNRDRIFPYHLSCRGHRRILASEWLGGVKFIYKSASYCSSPQLNYCYRLISACGTRVRVPNLVLVHPKDHKAHLKGHNMIIIFNRKT